MNILYNYSIPGNSSASKVSNRINTTINGRRLMISKQSDAITIDINHKMVVIEGELFYYSSGSKIEYLKGKTSSYISAFLGNIILNDGLPACLANLEGKYIAIEYDDSTFSVFHDNLKQLELFFYDGTDYFIASTDLSFITSRVNNLEIDKKVMGVVLSSHYQYTPSKHTIYKDIRSLGPDESIRYSLSGCSVEESVEYRNSSKYDDRSLNNYHQILERAILGRTDASMNIANSTGGWDSTFIISALVNMLGPDKVSTSTFNHVFRGSDKRFRGSSGRTEWNIYELNRAKEVANHFGVKHHEVQIDFNDKSIVDDLLVLNKTLKNHNCYAGSLPHYRMYKNLDSATALGGTIFSGEASDSVHNFGYSQYVPFSHTDYEFKEYGDKMRNYLYNGTFYSKVIDGSFINDKVFDIWSYLSGKVDPSQYSKALPERELLFNYLAPIIFSQFTRIPFEPILTSNELTGSGRENIKEFLKERYFSMAIKNLSHTNITSILMSIYKNIHLQGPTIKMIGLSARMNGFKSAIPFLDANVIDFLEKSPENWGRGLEWRRTKYALKEVINKFYPNFPSKIVRSGIHSYPSEVDPTQKDETYNFYFNSVATEYFRDVLASYSYRDILDDTYFNLPFIDKQVGHFINAEYDKISDHYLLIRLINIVTIGWDS